MLLALVLASACCSAYAASTHELPRSSHHLRHRAIHTDGSSLKSEYDFIIVGGGTAGLVLASRLTEDSDTSVLVIEAGDTGEAVQEQIDIPSETYYNGLTGSPYDWDYKTIGQTSLSGRTLSWPRGKVLGGSSAINGLYAVRPSKLEYDNMVKLQEGAAGADAWSWDVQFGEFKDSETFTSPDSALASKAGLEFNSDSHGTDGPLHVSWPGFMLPVVDNWNPTLSAVGVPTNSDPYGGENHGAFIALSCINPANGTRSYARNAYIDPLPPRSNLDILVNTLVSKVNFDTSDSKNITATGVVYKTSSGDAGTTVTAKKEVILAAGSIGTPQVLMLSGVGPSDVLSRAGVESVLPLPGVGQHLTDHLSAGVMWTTNADTSAKLRDAGTTDPNVLAWVNEAEAYLSVSTLFGGDSEAQNLQKSLSGQVDSAASRVPSSDSGVVDGYKTMYSIITDTYVPSELGHVELLFSTQGQKGADNQVILIQCALQHPLSSGHLYITTNDAFVAPTIDPQYFSNEFDSQAMVQCVKLARQIGSTAPLSSSLQQELQPGPDVQSDADIASWLASNTYTEYHPGGSCAMLPQSKGGCVDPKLRVYGTKNLRVIDASVFPMQFASHLQLSVYALAETGAKIIKSQYDGSLAPGEKASGSSTSSSSTPTSTSQDSGALRFVPKLGEVATLMGALFVGALLA